MNVLLMLVAVAAGFLLPFQAGANAQMGKHTPSQFHAALINFIVGGTLLAIISFTLATTQRSANASPQSTLASAPWWAWVAGAIGAIYVTTTVKLTPALGAVLMLACSIAGQAVGSMVVDQWGLMNLPVRPATPVRIAGVLLVVAGVVLIQRR